MADMCVHIQQIKLKIVLMTDDTGTIKRSEVNLISDGTYWNGSQSDFFSQIGRLSIIRLSST